MVQPQLDLLDLDPRQIRYSMQFHPSLHMYTPGVAGTPFEKRNEWDTITSKDVVRCTVLATGASIEGMDRHVEQKAALGHQCFNELEQSRQKIATALSNPRSLPPLTIADLRAMQRELVSEQVGLVRSVRESEYLRDALHTVQAVIWQGYEAQAYINRVLTMQPDGRVNVTIANVDLLVARQHVANLTEASRVLNQVIEAESHFFFALNKCLAAVFSSFKSFLWTVLNDPIETAKCLAIPSGGDQTRWRLLCILVEAVRPELQSRLALLSRHVQAEVEREKRALIEAREKAERVYSERTAADVRVSPSQLPVPAAQLDWRTRERAAERQARQLVLDNLQKLLEITVQRPL